MTDKSAVFLERQSYRRRRLIDSFRVLPLIGALLWMVPLMWPGAKAEGGDAAISTADATIFAFVVWALLVALAMVLSSLLQRADQASGGAGGGR